MIRKTINRHTNRGWRYEAHRHSLAARGIKTGYFGWKESFAASIEKGTKDPGEDEVKMDRERTIAQERERYMQEMEKEFKEDNVHKEARDDFVTKFGECAKSYREHGNRERFRSDLDYDFDVLKRSRAKRVKVWGLGDK